MTSKEFSIKCRPHNLKYRELFGAVPCPQDYAGSQDEFFNALVKAIETTTPIENMLRKRTVPQGDHIKI